MSRRKAAARATESVNTGQRSNALGRAIRRDAKRTPPKTQASASQLDDGEPIDYERLKAAAKQLGRPVETLFALSSANDPFYLTLGRQEAAKWFAKLWRRYGFGIGTHMRRVHYRLISQRKPVLLPSGEPFENTESNWDALCNAGRDARYLGLVPADHLVDRRNDEPVIYLPNDASGAELTIAGGLLENELHGFEVPTLELIKPIILQRFHLEIWCEKTTMNDVLLPLCERHGINLITGSGEQSLTACVNVVKRALASGRPVRILYVSDFDPAGASMPVAVARKIEFLLRQEALYGALDIQVRPVVLTHDQCVQYRLPRTPIKEGEKRAEAFEARFGEGATELDALEALHPGELARILTQEINRYYDDDLDGRIEQTAEEVQDRLDDVNTAVRKRHAKEIAALEVERKKLAAAIRAFEKTAKPVLRKIERDLEAEAPDVDAYDWPEPDEGDEDDDPLFDSTRDYLDQIDWYRQHQGKEEDAGFRMYTLVCQNKKCRRTFQSRRPHALTCSRKCRSAYYRSRGAKW